MASNWISFETQLSLLLAGKSVKSTNEFADKFANILDNSTVSQASTLFGNIVVSSNKSLIKNGIKTALDLGFRIEKYKNDLDLYLAEIQQLGEDLETITNALKKIPIPFFSSYIQQYLKKIENIPAPERIQNIRDFIKKIKIEDLIWFFAASQISLYYLTAQYSALPPNPPSTTPSIGTRVVSPGNVLLLATGLKYAFKSKTPQETANRCKIALESYTKTVVGVYSGITPAGAPSITPWIGVF
jgi:hypothetical protein